MEKFGSKLKALRKNKRMNQSELGEKLGVKQSTVVAYESGEISPSFEGLKIIAKEFDISTDELLGLPKKITKDKEWNLLIQELTEKGYTPYKIKRIIELTRKLKEYQ